MSTQTQANSTSLVGPLKVLMLSLLALVVGILSVSFASQYIRHGFEREFSVDYQNKLSDLASVSASLIRGDDFAENPAAAAEKYSALLPAMFPNRTEAMQGDMFYGVYVYGNGVLTPLYQNAPASLIGNRIDVSKWMASPVPLVIEGDDSLTVLTAIKSGDGTVVGLYELSGSHSFFRGFGATLEGKVLFTATISFVIGILAFSLHYVVPAVLSLYNIRRRQRGV